MDSTTRIFILSRSYHLVLLVQKRPSCRFGLRISYPLFKSSVNQIQELSLNWFWLSPLCVSYSLRIRWWLLISEWFCFFLLAQLPVAISLVCTNVRASEKKVKKKSWVASASRREGETCVCQKKKEEEDSLTETRRFYWSIYIKVESLHARRPRHRHCFART